MPPKSPWSSDASEDKRFKSEPTALESFDFHRSRYFLGMHSQFKYKASELLGQKQ